MARVLIMAGGTGGHVFPALAVADRLRQRGIDVHWLGTEQGLEARVIPAAGIELHTIAMRGVRGKRLLQRLSAPFMLLRAVCSAYALLRRLRPAAVLGMGGYAAAPGGLAARWLGIPLILHEQNAVAGTTNRLLAPFAQRVATGFPGVLEARGGVWLGNPVRQAITRLPTKSLGDGHRRRLLVLGGSLGAKPINDLLPAALALLQDEERPDVWHQTGVDHCAAVQQAYAEQGVEARVDPFIESMEQAYGWADLVICRAGALTVAEVACAGVAALFIPLPHAIDDHQTANARWLESVGAAQVLVQRTLTPQSLADTLRQHLQDLTTLVRMGAAARGVAMPAASEQVANWIEEYCHD